MGWLNYHGWNTYTNWKQPVWLSKGAVLKQVEEVLMSAVTKHGLHNRDLTKIKITLKAWTFLMGSLLKKQSIVWSTGDLYKNEVKSLLSTWRLSATIDIFLRWIGKTASCSCYWNEKTIRK